MKADQAKSKSQLISELEHLRAKLRGLEKLVSETRKIPSPPGVQEVSQQQLTEDAPRHNEETCRALLACMPDLVIRYDRECRHLFVSDNVSLYVKMTAREFIGKTHRELGFSKEDSQIYEDAIRRVFDTGEPLSMDIAFEGVRGKMVCDWRLVPEFDAKGDIQYVLSISRDITRQRRLEEDYQNLFQRMLDGFATHEIICDGRGKPVDYRFLAVNPSFERMTGLRAEEIVGRTVLEVLPGIERSWIETYGKVALTGEPAFFENYSDKLGKHFRVTAFQPEPGKFACIFSDVTDRKLAQEAMERYNERFTIAVDSAGIGVWEWNLATDELIWDDWMFRIYGIDKEDFSGSVADWKLFLHPQDRDRAVKQALEALEKRQNFSTRYRIVQPNGASRHIKSSAKIICNEQGDPLRMIGVNYDITELKRAEESAMESARWLKNTFDAMDEAVFVVDSDRIIRSTNPAVERIYGYSADELKDQTAEILHVDHEHYVNVNQMIKKAQETCQPLHFEYKVKRKNGEIFDSEVNIGFLQRGEGNRSGIVSLVRDITDRKEAEAALIRAKNAAEEANRAKSEFLANMSHEIRTPMNGVLGMLQLIQMINTDETQNKYIIAAIQSSKRLTSLLSDILDLSKVEVNRLSIQSVPFNLAAIVNQACELFAPTAQQAHIELRCHVDHAIPEQLNGDPARLQQILTNLIGNALKFTQKGNVVVEAYPLPVKREDSFRALFSITDTGIGIPDDKINELFEPFSQVSEGYQREYQGAGLGLSICKRLIELMDGSISIESEVGIGTTVHFCVTLQRDVQTTKPEPVKASAPILNRSLRILLAEDEKVNRVATVKLLEKRGHAVLSVENGAEAVSALKSGAFDIVLMDIQMPVMDGVEAAKAIRGGKAGERARTIPIAAMTAYAMGGDKDIFLASGMDDYIAKPVELEELEALFERVLNARDDERSNHI